MPNKTRFTGNLVSDDNIFVDIVNDRVGIGTTVPGAKLAVNGGVIVTGIVTASTFSGQINSGVGTITTLTSTTLTSTNASFSGASTNNLSLNSGAITGVGNVTSAGLALGVDTYSTYSLHWGDANTATSGYLFYSPGNPLSLTGNRSGTTSVLNLFSGGITLASASSLNWTSSHAGRNSSIDIRLVRDAANTLAQRNDTNPQIFRVYNTYTSSTNFERANVGWSTTNIFIVGTEKGSSAGTARQMEFQTDGITRVAITTTGNIGIGTTVPGANLAVNGGVIVTGIVTASKFDGEFVGIVVGVATVAQKLQTPRLIGIVGNDFTSISTSFDGTSDVNIGLALTTQSGVTSGVYGSSTKIPVFGVNNAGIITSVTIVDAAGGGGSASAGVATTAINVIGGIGSITQLQVTGISTFTNGPVLIGAATSTGTATQRLQVTGGAYISGNLGIGTTNPSYTLQVLGSFGATTKSFVVQHPTKPDKKLQYGSLESPYHGIRLTGKGLIENGKCVVTLPDYIGAFVKEDEINIQVTNIKHGKVLWIEEIDIENNNFIIKSEETVGTYEFYWDFTAIRKDVDDLEVEI